jgi:hypothetical protein
VKITCECGGLIVDQTDALPHKAHFIPDQSWFEVLDAMDEAIARCGPSGDEKEATQMKIRTLLGRATRSAWQCRACGRLFLDDQKFELQAFAPDSESVTHEIFRSRP